MSCCCFLFSTSLQRLILLPRHRPEVKKALGASPDRNFESCNMQLNQAFTFNGDGTLTSPLAAFVHDR